MLYYITENPTDTIISRNLKTGIYRQFFKRMSDILLSIMLAPVALVILIPFATLVSMDGGVPFFWQERIGRNGRVFKMLKLRSMVVNADAHLEHYLAQHPAAEREWREMQKLKNDPRVTRLGRFIRKLSIDELPQIWNVFIGEMSMVGPRPFMCCQKSLYPGSEYYDLRPGITGYWQGSDRSDCSFSKRAKFDAKYHNDLSFGADIGVLLRTVSAVVRATGY